VDKNTDNRDLVSNDTVKAWLRWGFFWAIFGPSVGIILSLKFNYPTFLSTEYSISAVCGRFM